LKVHTESNLKKLKNTVISIGIFDGVHKGHAAIFSRVREKAREIGGQSAIVTFWPHPRLVLGHGAENLKLLTSLEEKKKLIINYFIDHLIILDFTPEFSRLPACTFVKKYLVDGAGLSHLVFGFDHHFGHKREGNYENLKSCAQLYGFSIEQLDPVMERGRRVSSSTIREALFLGNVKLASELLSYPYMIEGKIVGGRQFGRAIGYPTANIRVSDDHKLIPANGVYAVEVLMGQKTWKGMMNIGYRPTLGQGSGEISLEVHIIDFDADVYNHDITIRFIDRIRDEKQFDSPVHLAEQLARDKAAVLDIMNNIL
jgi:riboflavin kinase / FMN adenylyltransferase